MDVAWHYVPIKENPVDLESCGFNQLDDLWRHGPQLLPELQNWTVSPTIE